MEVTGFGPNSGEITLIIRLEVGDLVEVFGGIMDSNHGPSGLEDGVFAAFVPI